MDEELLRAMLEMMSGRSRGTNLYLAITDADSGEPLILLNSPHEGEGRYWASDCGNPACDNREGCRRSRLVRNFNYIKVRVGEARVVDSPADVQMPVNTVPTEAGPIDPRYFQVESFINDLDNLFGEAGDA